MSASLRAWRHASLFLLAALVLAAFLHLAAPTREAGPQAAAERLRALYFAQEFEIGYQEGERLAAEFPDEAMLNAWRALNAGRTGRTEAALAIANAMPPRAPEDPWRSFALAGALIWSPDRAEEALAASEKAYALAPHRGDFLWLRAETLRVRDRKDEAIALLDANPGAVARSAPLLVVKGSAMFDKVLAGGYDEETAAAALGVFSKAQQVDRRSVDAYFTPGWFLLTSGRPERAQPLLKKAADLTLSKRVHQYYWRSALDRTDLSDEQKRAEIAADIEKLVRERGDDQAALYVAAGAYRDLAMTEKAQDVEARIFAQFPGGEAAEQVLWRRITGMLQDASFANGPTGAKKAELKDALRDFIARPEHLTPGLLGNAYELLFPVVRDDSSTSDDELYDVVKGLTDTAGAARPYVYADGAIALADRNIRLDEAQALVDAGLGATMRVIAASPFESEAARADELRRLAASMQEASGWVNFKAGRLDAAEQELISAYEQTGESLSVSKRLASVYIARGKGAEAENWLVRCLAAPADGEHPCEALAREFYAGRHGGLAGFEAYRAALAERVAEAQSRRIAESRIDSANSPRPFRMKTIDGKEVSSDGLRGKAVVINFWGLWCAACKIEMPELSMLAEKYAGAEDVAILTVNNDPNPARVREWMARGGYRLPVLIDDGYWAEAKIRGAPTTWFIGKDGAKAFEIVGLTPALEKEFSERIEQLRRAP